MSYTRYTLQHSIGVDAQLAGTELARINEKYGEIRPAHVVTESADEDAPLHPCFTWDDARAGHNWRLQEARSIVRAVHVIDAAGDDRGPAFVNVVIAAGENPDRAYLPMATVVADEELFASAVASLTDKIAGMKRTLTQLHDQARGLKKRHLKRAIAGAETVQKELGAI